MRLVFQQQQSGAKQKSSSDDQRKRLLDSAIIDVGNDDSWTNREDEPLLASGSSSSDMMSSYHQRKEQVLADQDKGLEALHEVIIRQKHLAGNIQVPYDTYIVAYIFTLDTLKLLEISNIFFNFHTNKSN